MADHVCTSVAQLNTALANAVAGDNILVRGVEGGGSGYYQTTNDTTGVSEVRINSGFHFANSGSAGNPITLKPYPGDTTPTLSNRSSGSSAYFQFPTITFGAHSYIVIDGIKVDGAIFMYAADLGGFAISGTAFTSGNQVGNVIKNCEIWEGWETTASGGDGNWSAIRVQAQSGALVRNNYIHDINDTGNCNNKSSMCGIKIFSGFDSVYEYNTILRVVGYSQAACIDDKQDSFRNVIRYNWCENVSTGPRIQNQSTSGASPATGTKFYQNVIIIGRWDATAGRAFTHEDGIINDYEFYNNTILVQDGSVIGGSDDGLAYASAFTNGAGAKIYNNIFYGPSSSRNLAAYDEIFGSGGLCDYNHWSDTTLNFRYGATDHADLAAFQGAGFEAHTTSGSPGFTNLGALDLTLAGGSSCLNSGKTGGTSGGTSVNKGAYLTGSETIGYSTPPGEAGGGEVTFGNVYSASSENATDTTLTIPSVTISSGEGAGVLITWRRTGTQAITGVTFNGSASGVSHVSGAGLPRNSDGGAADAYTISGVTGTGSVVVTFDAAPASIQGTVIKLVGVHATTPFGAAQASQGALGSSQTSTADVVVDSDGMVMDLLMVRDGDTGMVIGVDQTQRSEKHASGSIYHRTSTQDGADGGAMYWEWSSSGAFIHVAIPVIAAPAAPSAEAPFGLDHWPRPSPRRSAGIVTINTRPSVDAVVAVQPFNRIDWRMRPRPRRNPPTTVGHLIPEDRDPIIPVGWPRPARRRRQPLTVVVNQPPPPGAVDTTPPVITITTPTSLPTYVAAATPLTVGGTASDNFAVTSVTWSNNLGGSGTAVGTTSWSASVPLFVGINVITVTAFDAAGNQSSDVLTVTFSAVAEGPGGSTVRLSSVGIELGLGGRVRDIMLAAGFTQGCWPLSELQRTTFRDISGNGNHATLTGSGETRGVPTGLPEQAMGLATAGSVVLSVADDGITTGGINLVGGSIDIAGFIKTSTSDATERLIVTNRNSSAAGWYVGMINGQLRFRLRTTGGTDVFNFVRGSVADGAWHVFHCYYDPPTQEARVFIDGVQSGATVTTTNTDPEYIGAGVKILGGDPAGAGGFIGTACFIDIGREGNLVLAAQLQAARVWTEVSTDVRLRDGLRIRYGSSGRLVTDWVASSGSCSFIMENAPTANSSRLLGLYSPGHANCRTGFALGIPLRVSFRYGTTTRYKFQGRIISISPDAGPVPLGSRGVRVTATDWLDVAARSRYVGAEAQASELSTDVLKYLIDFADQSPGSVSIDAGTQVFGFALDQGRGDRDTILSELGRLAPSEMMYCFMRGNDTDGMTLCVETRFGRSAETTLDQTFADTMSGLELSDSAADILNDVRATCYPPTVDAAATSVLFSLNVSSSVSHAIPAMGSITIDAPYTDPNDRPSRVGGTALVTPVATTDFTGNSSADGTGVNRTSSLSVSAQLGASAMRAVISNSHTATVYLTKLQLRGKGIYRYQAAPAIATDDESIQKYGTAPLDLDMPYQQSFGIAMSLATAVKDIYGTPTTRPQRMTLAANHDSTLMTAALVREVGDRIGVAESVSGLTAGDGYYISEVEIECHGLHDLRVTWGLIPPWPERLLVSYTGPVGTQVHDLDVAPLELVDSGDYTFVFNKTGNTIEVVGAAGGGGGGAGASGLVSGGGGAGGGGAVNAVGIQLVVATSTYTGKVGASGVAGSPGTSGGVTEFRVPAGTIHMQLPGGAGGTAGSGGTPGSGGAGGAVGTGTGNIAGSSGGAGNGGAGTSNTGGAAGGGGGGRADSFSGGNGGDGLDIAGGLGGSGGSFQPGGNSSGQGGQVGTGGNVGGGGGGGGGVLIGGGYRGGGGGGAGAGEATGGVGGAGGGGGLTIAKV